MDKELLFVVGVFWLTSTAYVLYYFNKHHRVNFETVCFAILLGPIIALIMKDPEEEKYHYNYREDIPDFNHTPPPPPPKKQDKLKDFKFFQSDKDR
jgi:hypothetical protein